MPKISNPLILCLVAIAAGLIMSLRGIEGGNTVISTVVASYFAYKRGDNDEDSSTNKT